MRKLPSRRRESGFSGAHWLIVGATALGALVLADVGGLVLIG